MTKPRKRIMREFKMDEISAVDSPAQKPARAVIMKRDDSAAIDAPAFAKGIATLAMAATKGENMGARSFADILAEHEERRKQYEANDKLWPLYSALQDSLGSIAGDANLSPAGKLSAIEASIEQFSAAVRAEFPEIAEEIGKAFTDPGIAGIIKAAREAGGDTVSGKEKPMTDSTAKVAELEAQIATMKSENEALAKKASDAEAALAAAELAKNDATVVIDGETIRKSEVGEGAFKLFQKQQEKIELAAFEKRAEAEVPYLPGEAIAKAEALRAVSKLPEGARATIEQMLKAGSEAIGKNTQPLGKDGEKPVYEKADDELDALAKAYATEHKLTFAKAMTAVLDTPEGKAIYAKRNKAA